MKKSKKMILLLLTLTICLCMLLCSCGTSKAPTTEELIRQTIETKDFHNWMLNSNSENYTIKGIQEYAAKFPAFQSLLECSDLETSFAEVGIPILQEYIDGENSEYALNARVLGDMMRVLYPELDDEVNALLS